MRHPVHQDPSEGLSLQAPQPSVVHAGHRRRPRLTVHETQLPEAYTREANVRNDRVNPVVVGYAHLFRCGRFIILCVSIPCFDINGVHTSMMQLYVCAYIVNNCVRHAIDLRVAM